MAIERLSQSPSFEQNLYVACVRDTIDSGNNINVQNQRYSGSNAVAQINDLFYYNN